MCDSPRNFYGSPASQSLRVRLYSVVPQAIVRGPKSQPEHALRELQNASKKDKIPAIMWPLERDEEVAVLALASVPRMIILALTK